VANMDCLAKFNARGARQSAGSEKIGQSIQRGDFKRCLDFIDGLPFG
jgi:hypothetical protein